MIAVSSTARPAGKRRSRRVCTQPRKKNSSSSGATIAAITRIVRIPYGSRAYASIIVSRCGGSGMRRGTSTSDATVITISGSATSGSRTSTAAGMPRSRNVARR